LDVPVLWRNADSLGLRFPMHFLLFS